MQLEKNIFFSVVLAISQLIFPIITFPYLVNVLNPDKIGMIQFADSFAKYAAFIAALGLPIYGLRSIAKVSTDIRLKKYLFVELFFINACLTILIILLIVVFKQFIYPINHNPILFNWMLVYATLQLFNLDWYFIGSDQFKFIALRSLVFRILFILFIILFIKNTEDYNLYFIGMSICFFIMSIVNSWEVYKNLKPFNVNYKELQFIKHFKPLMFTFFTVFFISVYFSLDHVIVGMLSNNTELAYYAVATKYNKLIIAILTAITTALIPKMVKIESTHNTSDFIHNVDKTLYLIISIAIPFTLFTFYNAFQIVDILFGSAYLGAVVPMQITSLLILVVGLSSIFGFQILTIYQMDSQLLNVALIGMLSSIILFFILIPRYNAIGAAISILFTELIVCIGFIYFSKGKYNHIQFLKSILIQFLFYTFILFIHYIIVPYLNISFFKILASTLLFVFAFYILQFKIYSNTLFARNQFLNSLKYKIFNA
jgi:O-antigen/teichoic acid export membrane protein